MKSYLKRSISLLPACLFAAVLFAGNTFGSSAPGKVELSLKKAMAMAIHNNIDLRVTALDSSMAKVDIERSRGLYDPRLSISANHTQSFYTGETYGTEDTTTQMGLTQYLPTGGSLTAATYTGYSKPVSDDPDDNWTDWYTSVGITLVQPLLKNFGKEATELNITLAANTHQDSLERFRDNVIDTVHSVLTTYHRLYVLQQEAEERQSALSSARTLLEQLKQNPQAQSRQDIEIANTEYAISQRLKELVDAERKVRDKAAKLRYLIGMEEKYKLNLVDPPFRTEPLETEEQAIRLAMEQHPDLKKLRLELEANKLEERVAKHKVLPSLSMTAGTGFRGIEDQFGDSIEQIQRGKGRWWTAGLQFSMPLGNRTAKSDYRRKQLRTRQLKNQIRDLEWKLREYIEADMRSLVSARVQRQVADKSHQVAEQRLKQYRKSHQAKGASLQDMLNAENDLIRARNSQADALEDFANAVALLWKDAGVLLERLNINIDTSKPEQLTAGTEQISYPSYLLSNPQQLAKRNQIAVPAAEPNSKPPLTEASEQAVAKELAVTKTESTEVSLPQKTVAKPLSTPAVAVQKATPVKQAAKIETVVAKTLYTLKIGEYASSELARTKKVVERVGLSPTVTAGRKQARQVIRLKIADFETLAAAQQVQRQLKKLSAGGFIRNLGKAGFRLYAGSFFSRSSALKEQQRLVAGGIDLTLEEASVQLPTSLLTAGRFSDRAAAQAVASKLKQLGVTAVVQKHG